MASFFGDVEHGIEWLATPRNLGWLHQEFDKIIGGFKEAAHLVEELDHSVVFRHLLGLPQEAGATVGGPGVLHGIPSEDDGGALGNAIEGAQGKPGLLQRGWNSLFGGHAGPQATGGHRGGGPLDDPQSLNFRPQAADPDQKAAARESYSFWKGKGFSDAGASAMVANEKQESSFNPTAVGDHGTAGGIEQWHKDRRDAILGKTGIDVWGADHLHQLEAAYREMHDGIDAGAGRAYNRIRGATSASDAAASAVDDLERPLDRTGNRRVRGAMAESYQQYFQKQAGSDPDVENATRRTPASSGGVAGSLLPTPPPAGDPGAQRMVADARAGNAGDGSDATAATSAAARLARLKVEILHSNAPPGSTVRVSHDSPGYIDVDPPRTMGAMPTTGTQRNVARDGY